MAEYHTEEQQVEAIKRWWQENGKAVLTGLALGVVLLFGGRAWFQHQRTQAQEASLQFEALSQAVDAGNAQGAAEYADRLVSEYSGTPYATLAALMMAKVRVDAQDWVGATQHLQWAIDHAGVANIEHIARLRLARVYIAQGNLEAALGLLEAVKEGSFVPAYAEVKGDIYVAQGATQQARQAYELALTGEHWDPEQRRIVQMKLDDLVADVAEVSTAQ
ncbi:MAG: hypothetical protein AMJ69_10280 [Gammaproteobacteria bacterium SG8_47]|nr:MAG: hypothetical protein AMJ69_10280 [Gammaproteobacteria bacterium SG8_47]